MQVQCWNTGVGERLTLGQQLANFAKQVIADPHHRCFSRAIYICRTLVGVLVDEKVIPFFRHFFGKGNVVPVDWKSASLVGQNA